MSTTLNKIGTSKTMMFIVAALIACIAVYGMMNVSGVAHAADAFGKIDLNGSKVSSSTSLDKGIYKDMNTVLTIVLSIGGAIVIGSLIFAGVKLSTAQTNPQNRTQGFIGLAMALFGGWVVYKCLDLAGWIKGFGTTDSTT